MKYLHKRTDDIDTKLKSVEYNVVTIWEREFNKNREMQKITLHKYDLVELGRSRRDLDSGHVFCLDFASLGTILHVAAKCLLNTLVWTLGDNRPDFGDRKRNWKQK